MKIPIHLTSLPTPPSAGEFFFLAGYTVHNDFFLLCAGDWFWANQPLAKQLSNFSIKEHPMKKFLKVLAILVALFVLSVILLRPVMDRWGATEAEIAATFPGDELVPAPARFINRAITIQASPEQIYPWLVQIGADKGGWYSYDRLETLANCPNTNAKRIHSEWQNLQVGDPILMCPGETAPPPYIVAQLHPNQAIVMGHQENDAWVDLYQFVLVPQAEGSTRLVLRTRTMMVGGIWEVVYPIAFMMEQKMLRIVKDRAEHTEPVLAVTNRQTASLSGFGKTLTVSYSSDLAFDVEVVVVPAVPLNDQILFAEAHPAYAQFRFQGYQNAGPYQLPVLPIENNVPQVMVFQTKDFPGHGNGTPFGFDQQLQALTALLEAGLDPARCAQPYTGEEAPLPFLPWINARQSFCAHPMLLEFRGGRGIRYLGHYAQGPSPALEGQVFYTFQGLTEDGQFYISALFPVQTGIFPSQAPPCPKCGEPDYDPFTEWRTLLTEQLNQLNAQPQEVFSPSLSTLDELIKSVRITE